MWVKVCGIRDANTATEVATCGVNAIGLNFFTPSPRSISVTDAKAIVEVLPERITPVGLFVNHSINEVLETCQQLNLGTVQLHGDEQPEYLAEIKQHLPEIQIIRAYRMGSDGLSSLFEYLEKCDKLNVTLFACLIDAFVKGTFGGTGTTVAWNRLQQEYNRQQMPRLILAGGLNPTNIAEAIQAVNPWGVDVASGVESAAGVKEISLVKQLVANAR